MKKMLSDIEISQNAKLLKIDDIANSLSISTGDIEHYGKYKAKINIANITKKKNDGKLILVTAINPTPAGEGKSTVSVGLAQGLNKIGKKAVVVLREPSLGPVFGMKGGATGGGMSQVIPMEDINLHFTGDFHAITSAHNLIAACIDNHIKFGNQLNIDLDNITWGRVLDMNDRALRKVVLAREGGIDGQTRNSFFQITVASEIMAILCLVKDISDLKTKIADIIFAYNKEGQPLFVADLKIQGAVATLLKEAIKPNLVQTIEHTPAIIHGGPFANIAHGCNSVIATETGLKLSEYVVTEAGFGADLGAEKFLNIKCRKASLEPSLVVIVATIRALKLHGGMLQANLKEESLYYLEKGLPNLEKHIENMQKFNMPVIVAINQFITDSEQETKMLEDFCKQKGIEVSVAKVWSDGGSGAMDLATKVVAIAETKKPNLRLLYPDDMLLKDKITTIAKEIYGANGVDFSEIALEQLNKIEAIGYGKLPICMSKTQKSLSDNEKLMGRPKDFNIKVSSIRLASGAGFVIAMCGNLIDMPGLPMHPATENIDIDNNGNITGIF